MCNELREACSSDNVQPILRTQFYLHTAVIYPSRAQAIFAGGVIVKDEVFNRRTEITQSANLVWDSSQAGAHMNQSPEHSQQFFCECVRRSVANPFPGNLVPMFDEGSEFQRWFYTRCRPATAGPSKSERAESIRGFVGKLSLSSPHGGEQ